jgi:hypothetical protein
VRGQGGLAHHLAMPAPAGGSKRSNTGDSDAGAMCSLRELDQPVPSDTTTNSKPTSVASAAPVTVKTLLQPLNIGQPRNVATESTEPSEIRPIDS